MSEVQTWFSWPWSKRRSTRSGRLAAAGSTIVVGDPAPWADPDDSVPAHQFRHGLAGNLLPVLPQIGQDPRGAVDLVGGDMERLILSSVLRGAAAGRRPGLAGLPVIET